MNQEYYDNRGPIPLVEFLSLEDKDFSEGFTIDVFVPKNKEIVAALWTQSCRKSTKSFYPWYQDCEVVSLCKQ